mgnify:CR=1 FL=1
MEAAVEVFRQQAMANHAFAEEREAHLAELRRHRSALQQLVAEQTEQLRGEVAAHDAARHVAGPDGGGIQLTRAEYELLRTFVLNPGIVLSRDRLLASITHRQNAGGTRTVDVMVKRLRAKFGDDPRVPRIFGTSHGEGYVFTAPLS